MRSVTQQKSNSVPAGAGEVFGSKIGWMATVFGCWHRKLSRPFTRGKNSYRVCLQCGARKPFNPETMTTARGFYYPPKPPSN